MFVLPRLLQMESDGRRGVAPKFQRVELRIRLHVNVTTSHPNWLTRLAANCNTDLPAGVTKADTDQAEAFVLLSPGTAILPVFWGLAGGAPTFGVEEGHLRRSLQHPS
jgi:hypothetical protein